MVDIVITGAGGFIGRALVKRLQNDGHDVLALARGDGDITDGAFWNKLPGARTVVHLAGRSYVPESWEAPAQFLEANVIGTQHALDWCRRHGARMILAGAYVYGIPARLPVSEVDAPRPNNPYAFSKHIAEQCCEFAARHYGVDATVLRIFNVFGRGQRAEFLIPTLIRQLRENAIHVMDLSPRRDYVYISDVVDAFARALAGPQGFQLFNVGSGKSYSVAELVATLQGVAGTHLPVISAAAPRQQEIPDVQADIRHARRELGWKPTFDLATGIEDMLKEFAS